MAGIESEIREALTNLVFNAVDAMPDGGTLTRRTSDVCADAGALRARYVQIEVINTGAGIAYARAATIIPLLRSRQYAGKSAECRKARPCCCARNCAC